MNSDLLYLALAEENFYDCIRPGFYDYEIFIEIEL